MAPVGEQVKGAVSDSLKAALGSAKAAVQAAKPAQPAGGPPAAGQPANGARPAQPPTAMPQDPAERLAFLRRKILRDEDFVDNDDINRDPFRSYLRLFVEKPAARVHQVPAIFEKFALEELALIAVVSGDANPRAMFRDPSGLGQTVKRGDYVSKSAGRITKILSDRVIFELSEVQPNGESKAIEKAVLVNPEGARR
jgi:Tfp pilus assembly protein PilP